MADFIQHGQITTLHDLGIVNSEHLESLLHEMTQQYKIGLVLPVTASDMRAPAFGHIIRQLQGATFVDQIIVILNVAPEPADYLETQAAIASLGPRAKVLWADGERVQALYGQMVEAGLPLSAPGKGRSVWTAFGYLLADPNLKAFVLHDCDIVNFDRTMLSRLCLPLVHPALDYEFCKAYYARTTDQMHGRVVRLLVQPLLKSMISVIGYNPFLAFLESFRYPLAGEFGITANLARSNRIPGDWGLEVGTLAEVYRNTAVKRVCQVDLCCQYEHKHQSLSLEDPSKGLMKMATDILLTIFRTLASMGTVLDQGQFIALQSSFVRAAQDSVRQYHADSILNGLNYDRHQEELAIEGFAERIIVAGEMFQRSPGGGEANPNWTRVVTAFPDFPKRLRHAVEADASEMLPV